MQKSDALVLILVFILTVFWDLIFAVALGLILASLMYIRRMAEISLENSYISTLHERVGRISPQLPEDYEARITIKEINGPVFFGFANKLQELAEDIAEDTTDILIDFTKVPFIDKSGFEALYLIIEQYKTKGKDVALIGLSDQPKKIMEDLDIVPKLVSREMCFSHIEAVVAYVRKKYNLD